jgi:hypothetical protein
MGLLKGRKKAFSIIPGYGSMAQPIYGSDSS